MRIEKAVKRYGTKTALNVEGIEFPRGQICAVMGVNGCGKTTLARVLAGTTRPDEGGMILDAGETVGYMPQRSYAFYGTLAHNVALGAKGRRFDERCQELVEALGLSHLERESAKKLSGGETARMALARVLAGTWTHLVLDEPTAALDIPSTLAAERLMRDYCTEKNAGIVVVTAASLTTPSSWMAGASWKKAPPPPSSRTRKRPSCQSFSQYWARSCRAPNEQQPRPLQPARARSPPQHKPHRSPEELRLHHPTART